MKKIVIIFTILAAPFAFTACNDDAIDDVKPQVVKPGEDKSTEGEEAEDRGDE